MRSPVATVPSWPEELRERYREAGLWTDETFAGFVADRTSRFAFRLAVVGVDAHGSPVRWTYAELGEQAEHAAARLAAGGVEPGDRVVVALPNIVEYVAVVLGLFRMGALPVFALPTHREVELGQFCSVADAAALVGCGTAVELKSLYDATVERVVDADPPALVDVAEWDLAVRPGSPVPQAGLAAEDVAFLQLSGGTTGVSKLIPRTAADYLYSVRASAEICGLDESAVMLVVLPASHNFPMSSPGILGVLHVGGTAVLARDPSPATGFRLVAEERVTTVAMVPPLAQAWISSALRRHPDLSSLRTVQVGGARLSDAVARDIEPILHGRLQQVFGMAEGLVNYTRADDPDEIVQTSQGRPISEYDEIRIVDADGEDVPEGGEGSLLTRGPYTIRGYYRADAVNATSFTEDGFYRTGDLVRRLPSGHLVVTGRDKDQINRAGEKIAPDEVEGLLVAHPQVLDAVAVGVPDARLGESVWAVVRLEAGVDASPDLAAHLRRAGLADYKIPDRFVVMAEFPATHVGKNSRRELRRLLTEQLVSNRPNQEA